MHQHDSLSGRNLFLTVLLNVGITIAQYIGGFVSGSLSLISDATHNLSDVLSLLFSYIAHRLAHRKKQDLSRTFGYKRAEIIAAFVNAMTLIVISVFLIIEAVNHYLHPRPINGTIVIILAIIGILGNGWGVLLLKKDTSHSLNIRSAYMHLLADMLTSVVVLLGGLMIKYAGIYRVDSILTFIISLYLIYSAWDILKESLKILMLFAPGHIIIKEIEDEILALQGIRNIHHVHLWQLNDKDTHFEAHIEFIDDIPLSEFDKKCEQIEKLLLEKFGINHSNLQPEWDRDDTKDFIIQD